MRTPAWHDRGVYDTDMYMRQQRRLLAFVYDSRIDRSSANIIQRMVPSERVDQSMIQELHDISADYFGVSGQRPSRVE